MTELPRPSANRHLRGYLADVVAWHGYVRFLGLPSYQNNTDVRIDELYVPQALSDTHLSPDSDPRAWTTVDPVQQLLKMRHLVVLGDPGSGKSTLVNWFAWYLASGFARKLPGQLADLLPLPLVLRDLAFGDELSFEGLIAAFLKRPVAQHLAGQEELLWQYLRAGRVLLLVDGLDEVGLELRRQVSDALMHGIVAHPGNHLLCTSRIVGYDDAPLMHAVDAEAFERGVHLLVSSRTQLSYVAPFTDEQIEHFALNWYRDQGGPDREARSLRDDFVAAIRSNDSTLRLARTPNLLTMMALVYRVRARLPNGRALLYEDIAQAYLESIDTARKLKDEFPWQSKKRWLARVGFEMQLRRADKGQQSGSESAQELLIPRDEILGWIRAAMRQSGDTAAEGYAEKYLEWITRRSGLLLPRGEGQFAFLHLSFQEYFAALYLKQQMESPDWIAPEADPDAEAMVDPRITAAALGAWAGEQLWQQVFVLLFELFSGQTGWTRRLLAICFPKGWSDTGLLAFDRLEWLQVVSRPRAWLHLQVLGNPHGGLSERQRAAEATTLGALAMAEQALLTRTDIVPVFSSNSLLVASLSTPTLRQPALTWLSDAAPSVQALNLDRVDASALPELMTTLSGLQALTRLRLSQTAVSDIAALASLPLLKELRLQFAPLADLGPLRALSRLRYLSVARTQVADLQALAGAQSLEVLWLEDTQVHDFAPLAGLHRLSHLNADNTAVAELAPLAALRTLNYLSLAGTRVVDLGPLAELDQLTDLHLDRTGVADLSPLARLARLETLKLQDTQVTDFSPLAGLKRLTSLTVPHALQDTARRQLATLPNLSITISR